MKGLTGTTKFYLLALAGGVLVAAACGSPSEPVLPFEVAFSSTVSAVGWNAQTARHECEFTLTAEASGGEAGDFASWLPGEGEYRWDDGSRQFFALSEVDMLDHWGSDRILTGETKQTNRIAWSSVAFRLVYTFRFLDPTGRAVSKVLFIDCR
jgi:hypothetical protein